MAASLADIRVPPQCREMIRAGALVSINTSRGKHSQAMTILLSRIVPRDCLVAVHAPLGEVEWQGTLEHIRATIPLGIPLILAPVASGKTLLDRVEERGKFPGIRQHWCTGDFKITPIERELRRFAPAVDEVPHRPDQRPARSADRVWQGHAGIVRAIGPALERIAEQLPATGWTAHTLRASQRVTLPIPKYVPVLSSGHDFG